MMSNFEISNAFEIELEKVAPSLPTNWEGVAYTPQAGVPYQAVNMLFARPENPTLGDQFFRQRGYLQVQLRYPLGVGRKDAQLRGEKLRAYFKRGFTVTHNGVTAIVDETPEIGSGSEDGDRWNITVRIRFYCDLLKEG